MVKCIIPPDRLVVIHLDPLPPRWPNMKIDYDILKEDIVLQSLENYKPNNFNFYLKLLVKKDFKEWSQQRAIEFAKAIRKEQEKRKK